MKYLNISKLAVLIFAITAMFTACSEDNIIEPEGNKSIEKGIVDVPFSKNKSANVQLSFNFFTGNITVVDGDITQEWVYGQTRTYYTRKDALDNFGSQIPTVEDMNRLHIALRGSQYTIAQVLGLKADGLQHYNPNTGGWPIIYPDDGYFWLADKVTTLADTYWCGHMRSDGSFAIAHNQLISKLQVVKIINR